MTAPLSRRTFLKSSVAVAGSLATGGGLAAAAGSPADGTREPLATLLDIRKCIGCEECVYACRQANDPKHPRPVKPYPRMYPARVPVQDWSEKTDVMDRLTPYNWLFIQHATGTVNGETFDLTIPRRCMHCANPPCVKLCPWGSAKQEDNGLSRIDPDLCLGGSKCKSVCPWSIPERQTGVGLYLDLLPALAGNGVMYKCDRCYDRLALGEMPACIQACPEGVQTIGPRSEIIRQAHDLARDINGYLYGETENGGTHTIYVSPVPFDQLDQSIDKGDGRPHLGPVKNMMADGNNIAKAMLIAPLAGIAAAFGRLYSSAGKQEDRS